jgi:hypothetical protein
MCWNDEEEILLLASEGLGHRESQLRDPTSELYYRIVTARFKNETHEQAIADEKNKYERLNDIINLKLTTHDDWSKHKQYCDIYPEVHEQFGCWVGKEDE